MTFAAQRHDEVQGEDGASTAVDSLDAFRRLGPATALLAPDGATIFSTAAFDALVASHAGASRDVLLGQLAAALRGEPSCHLLHAAGRARFSCRRDHVGDVWAVTALADAGSAYVDPLTGLSDRLVLRGAIAALYAAGDDDWRLLLIDLDRFKAVNDTLGHPVGDRLLCLVIERIKRCLSPKDLLVRMGGDEFAVLRRAGAADDAAALASRLIDLVSRPYIVDQHLITVGASVGVAQPSDSDGDPDRLITLVDLALYAAKESGRGRARFFEPMLETRAQERRRLEQDLRRGVALRQFELFYQPQTDTVSGRVTGLEALVRWRHPTRGLVSPAVFVPIAEESGAIVPLGEWILRTACRDAAAWPEEISVAVNLSALQVLDPNLVRSVVQSLAHSGLPPHRLELEITETALIRDMEAAFVTLKQLRALGVRIAMDDFGTGYSSLSYLRAFPFDKVKIDQSFVREMPVSADTAAIVKAIVDLGGSLGMRVTAEGVETVEQREMLRALGCGQLQGYLFSRPVPLNQIEDILSNESQSRVATDRLLQP